MHLLVLTQDAREDLNLQNNGTLFLDEIGDMPLPLQAKLLRAIETRKIQRVGGKSEIELNLRLICATHQNIEKN